MGKITGKVTTRKDETGSDDTKVALTSEPRLRIDKYDHTTHEAVISFEPSFSYASNGQQRQISRMTVQKQALAYMIGAKEGEEIEVGKGVVHPYISVRVNEEVGVQMRHRAYKHRAEKRREEYGASLAKSIGAVVVTKGVAAVDALEALAKESGDPGDSGADNFMEELGLKKSADSAIGLTDPLSEADLAAVDGKK